MCLQLLYTIIAKKQVLVIQIPNRIYESRMYIYFVSKKATSSKRIAGVLQGDVVDGGRFDMELCLRKFA